MRTVANSPRPKFAQSIGRYELLEPLGSGGMGTVHRARHVQLHKSVAVKLLNPDLASRPGALARFLREARAAAQIRHPNVIDVFDVGVDDGAGFLAMELLEGSDLSALLRARGRLELHELVELLLPVLAGVRAAHEAGVVHRDLKPSNVFLAKRGRSRIEPVVLDFGVSRLLSDDLRSLTPITEADAMIGTAAYVAPEQAKRGSLADHLSDQYSLAVIAYECVTGERPFTGNSAFEVLHAIATAPVRPPSALNSTLPVAFDAVVLRALARDPAQRFEDLDAFARALLTFGAPRTWMTWGRELAVATDESEQTGSTALELYNTAVPASAHAARPVALQATEKRETRRGPLFVAFGSGALLALSGAAAAWPVHSALPTVPTPVSTGRVEREEKRAERPALATSLCTSRPSASAAPSSSAMMAENTPPRAAPAKGKRARPALASAVRAVELGKNDAPILE